ncbi:MAG: FkbM family methyltransferase [Planctomycetota bacterium]
MKSLLRDLTSAFRYRRFVTNPWMAATARRSRGAGTNDETVVPLFLRGRGELFIRRMTSDIHVFKDVYMKDAYHLDALAAAAARGKPLDRVIEIGGHIGVFATRVATLAGRVLSCEPMPPNAALFRRNVDSLHCDNVTLLEAAVTATGESLTLFASGNTAGHSAFQELAGERSTTADAQAHTVDSVTLQELLARDGGGRCNLLKIDCEGGEYDILLNADEDSLARVDRVVLEYHNVPYGNYEQPHESVVERLQQSGFTVNLEPSHRHPSYGYIQAWRGPSWV